MSDTPFQEIGFEKKAGKPISFKSLTELLSDCAILPPVVLNLCTQPADRVYGEYGNYCECFKSGS